MSTSLLSRLSARDRSLFFRWALGDSARKGPRRFWTAVTHLGGARFTILSVLLPLTTRGAMHDAARLGLSILVVSHLIVQAVKRTVGRPRPSLGLSSAALVDDPDRFSFPSGHSAAILSVALGYAWVFPVWSVPLLGLAFLVGLSRTVLGVHYPGDVLAGQAIALATGLVVLFL
jgi:undecaprenyl-diphosphatase